MTLTEHLETINACDEARIWVAAYIEMCAMIRARLVQPWTEEV